jgi:hypothetical protein
MLDFEGAKSIRADAGDIAVQQLAIKDKVIIIIATDSNELSLNILQ